MQRAEERVLEGVVLGGLGLFAEDTADLRIVYGGGEVGEVVVVHVELGFGEGARGGVGEDIEGVVEELELGLCGGVGRKAAEDGVEFERGGGVIEAVAGGEDVEGVAGAVGGGGEGAGGVEERAEEGEVFYLDLEFCAGGEGLGCAGRGRDKVALLSRISCPNFAEGCCELIPLLKALMISSAIAGPKGIAPERFASDTLSVGIILGISEASLSFPAWTSGLFSRCTAAFVGREGPRFPVPPPITEAARRCGRGIQFRRGWRRRGRAPGKSDIVGGDSGRAVEGQAGAAEVRR